MKKEREIVTIEDIQDSLCNFDTEYREGLAECLMDLKYLSDSPLNLRYGTEEQQEELIKVRTTPLKANQINEIMNYMLDKMKTDFQYASFERVAQKYINISKRMELEEEEEFE